MKNFRVVLIIVFILPLLAAATWQDPNMDVVFVNVSETPTETPDTSTATPDTPTSTPDVPTSTPDVPTSTPDSTTSTPMSSTSTPDTSTSSSDEETIVETPSVIPSLGNGPRVDSVLLYGSLLLMLFGVVTLGWVKVWQAYRQQNL